MQAVSKAFWYIDRSMKRESTTLNENDPCLDLDWQHTTSSARCFVIMIYMRAWNRGITETIYLRAAVCDLMTFFTILASSTRNARKMLEGILVQNLRTKMGLKNAPGPDAVTAS